MRLSFDQEAWDRGLRSMPLEAADHAAIGALLRHRLIELVEQGRDAVLDFSFWSRAMRQDWRALLEPLGVVPETIYLATDRQTCLRRVEARVLGTGTTTPSTPRSPPPTLTAFSRPPRMRGL